jgi:hypothetical protein
MDRSNPIYGKLFFAMLQDRLLFDVSGISKTNERLVLTITITIIDWLLTPLRNHYSKKGLAIFMTTEFCFA